MKRGYVGWELPRDDRARLLAAIPPAYPRIIAHHVTLAFGVGPDHPLPKEKAGEIVGIADDGQGLQALVVAIGGRTDRPGGGTYHVTWSLGPGRRPVESNDLLRDRGWTARPPVPVALLPRFFPIR